MNILVPLFLVSSCFSWFLDKDLNDISLHLACFDFVRKTAGLPQMQGQGEGRQPVV